MSCYSRGVIIESDTFKNMHRGVTAHDTNTAVRLICNQFKDNTLEKFDVIVAKADTTKPTSFAEVDADQGIYDPWARKFSPAGNYFSWTCTRTSPTTTLKMDWHHNSGVRSIRYHHHVSFTDHQDPSCPSPPPAVNKKPYTANATCPICFISYPSPVTMKSNIFYA